MVDLRLFNLDRMMAFRSLGYFPTLHQPKKKTWKVQKEI